jgi:hypothetical protein
VVDVEAPTELALRQANCWFPDTDRVAGRSDITAFKQRARLHQARWREAHGYPIGSHPRPGGTFALNGSKLAPSGPRDEDFRNFLDSRSIRQAVRHRSSTAVKKSESGQQFKEDRLRYDLLSSMPMCFNLFGELHGDVDRLSTAGEALFGIEQPGLDVRFEHSPRRRHLEYSNDGTAFDVALYFGATDGPQSIIGIETKYHEHAVPELKPDSPTSKRPVIALEKLKMPRYRAIAERAVKAGIFKSNWEDLLGSELQQVWRDHLLLLSMLQHPGGRWTSGKYVLVHPSDNPSFAEAGEHYRDDFLDDASTFDVLTIEALLRSATLNAAETELAFRARYLW